jgi:hypothetical protein
MQTKLLEALMQAQRDVITEVSAQVVKEAGDALNSLVHTCNSGFRITHVLAHHKRMQGLNLYMA